MREAIQSIYWPPGNDQFVVRPEENANGVNPITSTFEENLDAKSNWESTGRAHFKTVFEERGLLDGAITKLSEYYDHPEEIVSGPWFDAVRTTGDDSDQLIAVEWETGNISSSPRSLNRLTVGLITGLLRWWYCGTAESIVLSIPH